MAESPTAREVELEIKLELELALRPIREEMVRMGVEAEHRQTALEKLASMTKAKALGVAGGGGISVLVIYEAAKAAGVVG